MLYKYLLPTEQQQLVNAAAKSNVVLDRRDHAWMRAMMLSGLRVQEFSRITLGAALTALRDKYLFIPREHRKGGIKDHRVFITAPLRQALEDLIAIHFEISGDEKSSVESALVISRQDGGTGRPMSVRMYQLRLKHWAAVAGLSGKLSPHWLRHTRAMNIMRSSCAADPRGVAQAALAHVSISSTGIYTGVTREALETALAQTDAPAKKRLSLRQMRANHERGAS